MCPVDAINIDILRCNIYGGGELESKDRLWITVIHRVWCTSVEFCFVARDLERFNGQLF